MSAVETMLAVAIMIIVVGAVVYVVNKAKAKKDVKDGGKDGVNQQRR